MKSKTTIDDLPTTKLTHTLTMIGRENEEEAPFEFPYSNADYVDVSQCMIDRMNQGDFDKNPINQNVSTFSLCHVCNKQATPFPTCMSLRLLVVGLALLSDAQLLLRHVDTVQELTDILVSHQHRLVDLSSYLSPTLRSPTRSGHSLDVVTLQNDLILLGLGLGDSHSLQHVDVAHSLLTEEVTNLHLLSLLVDGNVDGEVSVHEAHLVAVSVGDSGHHVLDVAADRAHHSNVLVKSEPQVDDDSVALLLDVHKLVAEVAAQDATGSLDHNASVLDEHLD